MPIRKVSKLRRLSDQEHRSEIERLASKMMRPFRGLKKCPPKPERVRMIAEWFASGKYRDASDANQLKRLWGVSESDLELDIRDAMGMPDIVRRQRELAEHAFGLLVALRRTAITTKVQFRVDRAIESLNSAFGAYLKHRRTITVDGSEHVPSS